MVRFDVANRPITVVSGECTYRSALVPKTPGILWILCDWADPKCVGV